MTTPTRRFAGPTGVATLLGGLLLVLAGCVPEAIRIEVVRPAELDIAGVETVAVAGVEVAASGDEVLRGRDGRIQASADASAPSRQAARQVGGELIDALADVPHYRLVDTDVFREIYARGDLADLSRRTSFNPDRISAVVLVTVWAGSISMASREEREVTLETWAYRDKPREQRREGRRGRGGRNRNQEGRQQEQEEQPPPRERVHVESRDELVETESREVACGLAARFTLVRLVPRVEVITSQTTVLGYTDAEEQDVAINTERPDPNLGLSLTGGEEEEALAAAAVRGIDSADQALARLARRAVQDFVEKIAPTRGEETVRLARAGDEVGRTLIREGAYDGAIRRLTACLDGRVEGVTYEEPAERAPDLYHLGLAHEARGPDGWQDAAHRYRQALAHDLENELYAEGLGRISQALRAWSRLEHQRILRGEEVEE